MRVYSVGNSTPAQRGRRGTKTLWRGSLPRGQAGETSTTSAQSSDLAAGIELPKAWIMPNIVVISDTHAGSIYSPINPDTQIRSADGTHFHPENRTAVQDWLWRIWVKVCAIAMDLPDFTLIHLGDLCQGDRHPGELVSDNIAHQPELAVWTLKPLLALPNLKRVELILGTAAHNGGQGALEMIALGRIKAERPDVEVDFSYHRVYYTDGGATPFLDAAHHGPGPGIYTHTAGNIARNHLRNAMVNEVLNGRRPPRWYFRGHYHTKVQETVRVGGITSDIILMPSLAGANEYSLKAARSPSEIEAGGLIIRGENAEWITESQDIRQRSILA